MADFDLKRRLKEEPNFLALSKREQNWRLRTNRASLQFFARSEHSFIVENDEIWGFILAQAIWQGDRAIVWISSLEAEQEIADLLLDACIKSAYDAGVYEIHLVSNVKYSQFTEYGHHLVRFLGSRSQ